VKKNYHLYLGKAGHLTVMSEFLTRGWNVAIPEVDIGDDIFVVQDDNGILRRVQVKTSTSTRQLKGYKGQFNIPLSQLHNILTIPVHYIFIARHEHGWNKPVIIRQDYLLDLWGNNKLGSVCKGNLNLHFTYSDGKVKCSKIDISAYIADFTDFPLIQE
jgi:hypothetical protein